HANYIRRILRALPGLHSDRWCRRMHIFALPGDWAQRGRNDNLASPRLARRRCFMSTTAASVVDVLIVEDDADTRESLRLVLELEGFVCEEAEDGRQALEAARQFRPHVILLDVMLPVLNGLKVMRKLRADERTRNILVYCLSGRADAEVQA